MTAEQRLARDRSVVLREHALSSFRCAIEAADPRRAVRSALESDENGAGCGRVRTGLVAFGKAAVAMTEGVLDALGPASVAGGVVVTDRRLQLMAGRTLLADELLVVEASHPVPDGASVRAAEEVERFVASGGWDQLLVLVSGGGSSLLCAPVPGLTLEDKMTVTGALLSGGADITETNTVRKHLSRVKGGQLARTLRGRPTRVLVLSDVPGDDLAVVASGPFCGDPTTFGAALDVVERKGLLKDLPPAARDHLRAGALGERSETPAPGDPVFASVSHQVVGGNFQSVKAAAARCIELGFQTEVEERPVVGEARDVAVLIAQRFGSGRRGRWAWVAGGETTVTLRGEGRGGRNQELALAFALARDRLFGGESAEQSWALLSAGTDGLDGPTDAAGGLVDSGTLRRAREADFDPRSELEANNSYVALDASGDLVRTGPTGTNVADVQILLVDGG